MVSRASQVKVVQVRVLKITRDQLPSEIQAVCSPYFLYFERSVSGDLMINGMVRLNLIDLPGKLVAHLRQRLRSKPVCSS